MSTNSIDTNTILQANATVIAGLDISHYLLLDANGMVGLVYSIPIGTPKGFGIILNSVTQQKWTLFMTDSIHT